VLTWQTGYPFGVDYARGYPRYAPGDRGLDRLLAGGIDAALVVGSPAVGEQAAGALGRIDAVAIGPRASEAVFGPRVAIDTGVAGIHEEGTAYRMDEVPLALHPPLTGRRSTAETLLALTALLQARLPGKRA
jgi:formylmethanofuran dehydrogenase subunit B